MAPLLGFLPLLKGSGMPHISSSRADDQVLQCIESLYQDKLKPFGAAPRLTWHVCVIAGVFVQGCDSEPGERRSLPSEHACFDRIGVFS